MISVSYTHLDVYKRQDKSSVEVREIGENTYIVEGAMTLNDFNEHFDTELESDDVDTCLLYTSRCV